MAKTQTTRNNGKKNGSTNGSTIGRTTTPASTKEKNQKTLDDLLKDGLKDMFSAEKQLTDALPEMAKACNSEDLQDAFEKHHQQTLRHVERLEKVMARLGMESDSEETCEAMQGLITEAKEIIENYEMSPVRDSALIIAAQKVEHYEIASYGSLCELCDVLGYPKLSDLLGRTLQEEENTDKDLSALAQEINDDAHDMSLQEQEETYGE